MRISSSYSDSFHSSSDQDPKPQVSGEFNQADRESGNSFTKYSSRIEELFEKINKQLAEPNLNREEIAHNLSKAQKNFTQIKKGYENARCSPKYEKDPISLNITKSLQLLDHLGEETTTAFAKSFDESDEVLSSGPLFPLSNCSSIEKALQVLYELKCPEVEEEKVQESQKKAFSAFGKYTADDLIKEIERDCKAVHSKCKAAPSDDLIKTIEKECKAVHSHEKKDSQSNNNLSPTCSTTEFPRTNRIGHEKQRITYPIPVPVAAPRTVIFPPKEEKTRPYTSSLESFGSFSGSAKKTDKTSSSPNKSPRIGSGSSPRSEFCSIFKRSPREEKTSTPLSKTTSLEFSANSSCNFEISKEESFFYATLKNATSCDHLLKGIFKSKTLEKIPELNKIINPSNHTNEEIIEVSAANLYGIKVVGVPTAIKPESHKISKDSLEIGLFNFSTRDEYNKPTNIVMNTSNLTPAVFDKESNQVFSSPKEIYMCDFIATPNYTDFEDIKKLNNFVVLTSGCGMGELSHKAAKKAAKKIHGIFNKSPEKTNKIYSIIHKQLKSLHKTNKTLLKNPQKYGATEVTIASIVGNYLIVSNIGNIKTFILEKTDDKLDCFELRDLSFPATKSFIGNLPEKEKQESINQVSCAVFNLNKGDYKIVLCSKGTYDNLDPRVKGKHLIKHVAQKSEEQILKERSELMANNLKNIFSFCKNPNAFNSMKALEKYLYALSFKEKKKVLEGGYLHLSGINFKSESDSEEAQKAPVNTNKTQEPSWENLINTTEGKAGFAAFAIMPYNNSKNAL